MNNQMQTVRCVQCGQVDAPRGAPAGPAWIAIVLWAGSGVLWAIGLLLSIPSVLYIGLVLFLPALIYTLWYFYKREQACRHCGSRTLEHGA